MSQTLKLEVDGKVIEFGVTTSKSGKTYQLFCREHNQVRILATFNSEENANRFDKMIDEMYNTLTILIRSHNRLRKMYGYETPPTSHQPTETLQQ